MNCCASRSPIETQFDERVVDQSLAQYRRKGPRPATRLLIDAILKVGLRDATVLDVGCGIGVIDHELLASDSVARVTLVDASGASLAAARHEMERRGTLGRAALRQGDFIDLASDIPPADMVLLDRVICCYPDLRALLTHSADHAGRLLGAIYPRSAWWVEIGTVAENALRRLRSSAFRTFVHSPDDIDAMVRRAGFARRTHHRGAIWEVALYERAVGGSTPLSRR